MNINPLGFGVTRKRSRYQAQIRCAGRIVYLGTFPTHQQAAAVAAAARSVRTQLTTKAGVKA